MSSTPAPPVRSITIDDKLKSLRSWVLFSLVLKIVANFAALLTITGTLGSFLLLHKTPDIWDFVFIFGSVAAVLFFATAHASAKMEHAALLAEKYSLAGKYSLAR